MRRGAPDRRSRLGRGLAGPRAGRGAAGGVGALVESAIRHCRYLERAVEVSGLANVRVVNARAEAWPEGLLAHDLVTARALAALPGDPGVRRAAARRGRARRVLEGRGRRRGVGGGRGRGGDPGPRALEPLAVTPYAGARDHSLHAFRKIAPTPDRFPRRPGWRPSARSALVGVSRETPSLEAWDEAAFSDCRTTGADRPGPDPRRGLESGASAGSSCRRRSAGATG